MATICETFWLVEKMKDVKKERFLIEDWLCAMTRKISKSKSFFLFERSLSVEINIAARNTFFFVGSSG